MKTIRLFTLLLTLLITGSMSAQCDASFTFTTNGSGVTNFVPLDSTIAYTYYWDFGDGNTSNVGYPTNTYNTPGTYTVCLLVSDAGSGCTDTVCNTLTISGSGGGSNCDATFTTTNPYNAVYELTNPGSYDSYTWDMGDGTVITGSASYTHMYAANGNYTACLTVTDSVNGCTDTYCDLITVTYYPSAGACDASFTMSTDSACTLYYMANYTIGSNYFWNFGDGSSANNVSGTHTYSVDGTYTVSLMMSNYDSIGNFVCVDTTYQTVVINCNGGGSGTGGASCNASFYLFQDSTNLGAYYAWNLSTGNNLTYFWDFGDGNTSTQAYPVHTYATIGSYQLCLTVADANGNCTSTFCDSINVVVKANGTTLGVSPAGQFSSVENVDIVEELALYPNPNNGQFSLNVNLSEQGEFTIAIMNYVGQVVEQNAIQLSAGQNVVDMNIYSQPTGIYIVNIRDEKTGVSRNIKLIKE